MNTNKRFLNFLISKANKKRRISKKDENNTSEINEKYNKDELEKEENDSNFYEEEDYEEDEEDYEDEEDEEEEEDEESCIKREIEDDEELNVNFKIIKDEISKNEPNARELLTVPMRKEDRARLSFYYENYKSHEPYSVEWIESRETYNQLLKEFTEGYKYYEQYSETDILKFQEEENKFKMFNPQLALKYKILKLETSHNNKEVIYKKYNELIHMETSDDEYSKTKNWLTWATDIPHDKLKTINIDDPTKFICKAKQMLDKELYGMEDVKEQILLFLSAKIKSPDMINTNLALLGPPGTGKTSIARLVSKIMEWGFAQISFGGIEKADFLKGHEYTYVGSGPGEIVKSLKKIGCKNGVIFLDEMDKISENPDIKSALLHIIDPSQNKDFRDMFLSEITIDLSNIWWVSSMNQLPDDSALADRWSIINIQGYDYDSKINIVKDYLLPKALQNTNLEPSSITFNDDAIKYLINNCSPSSDKGVRTLEKNIKEIVNKINFIITHQDEDGNLPFKVSFQLKHNISLPLIINKNILF
jgi:ATP-dependent Lon protease